MRTNIDNIAVKLLNARNAFIPISTLPSELNTSSVEIGYFVLEAYNRLSVTLHGNQCGWKMGATNDNAMKSLGLTVPFCGPLHSIYIYKPNSHVKLSELGIFRAAEAEFCIKLKGKLPPKAEGLYDVEEVWSMVKSIYPAIEIASTRFDVPNLTPAAVIADFALNGCICLGNDVELPENYLSLSEADAILLVNDIEVARGKGSDVLTNPIVSLTWLANELNKHGKMLMEDDIVMTGAAVASKLVTNGDKLTAKFKFPHLEEASDVDLFIE